MANSIQSLCKGSHEYIVKSLQDILYPKPEDNRTPEQMVADIMERAGLNMESNA